MSKTPAALAPTNAVARDLNCKKRSVHFIFFCCVLARGSLYPGTTWTATSWRCINFALPADGRAARPTAFDAKQGQV